MKIKVRKNNLPTLELFSYKRLIWHEFTNARRANTEAPVHVEFFHLRITSVFNNCVFGTLSSAGHTGERFHFFNLSSFGSEERMIKAEFRWFRKKQKIYLAKVYAPHFCKVSGGIS